MKDKQNLILILLLNIFISEVSFCRLLQESSIISSGRCPLGWCSKCKFSATCYQRFIDISEYNCGHLCSSFKTFLFFCFWNQKQKKEGYVRGLVLKQKSKIPGNVLLGLQHVASNL